MRLARTLLLAAATAIAAIAFMASSALAQSIEVENETPGTGHCGEVIEESAHNVSGGCEITAASEDPSVTFAHVTGAGEIATSGCQNAFTANIDEDGVGYIDTDEQSVQESEATGCALEECDEAETGDTPHADLEWPIAGIAETGNSTETVIFTFCIRQHTNPEGSGNTPCTVPISIVQTAHAQEFVANGVACLENPILELTGHWVTIGTNEIELHHIHYPGDNP